MIPDLLLVTAGDLRDNELDILGDQLALLPGDRLTGLCPSPHLINTGMEFYQETCNLSPKVGV